MKDKKWGVVLDVLCVGLIKTKPSSIPDGGFVSGLYRIILTNDDPCKVFLSSRTENLKWNKILNNYKYITKEA